LLLLLFRSRDLYLHIDAYMYILLRIVYLRISAEPMDHEGWVGGRRVFTRAFAGDKRHRTHEKR
jgi:hypothetical protein